MKNVILPVYKVPWMVPRLIGLCFLLLITSSALQAGAIRDKVTDGTAARLPGVNILLRSTTIGTEDDSGRYSFNRPDSDGLALPLSTASRRSNFLMLYDQLSLIL